ncbi:MAG TPA: PaeR7I family type II restriction endonuclease [Micromonosporaceae bacterium]|nr:PaeR7I family type II restriction endonuclease [Micromonosporaceae bacterium]
MPAEQVHYRSPRDKDESPKRNKRLLDEIGSQNITLPGYYRPTKQWDLVVYHDKLPIVIIELKSQTGPSYGNNANNRAEEAIGNAVDLARAREVGLVPGHPWTGYVFVIEDDAASRRRGAHRDRSFYPKDVIFADWSHIDRVRLLSQRLVEDGLYDAAWAVATSRPTCPGAGNPKNCPQLGMNAAEHLHRFGWHELDTKTLSYVQFTAGLVSQIRQYYSAMQPTEDPITFLD